MRDRLSNLPDDLINKIFSTISTKLAVQTCVLSSRWRFMWTSIPYLNISSEDFETSAFSKFARDALSLRNSEIEVSSVKLIFGTDTSQWIVKDIMKGKLTWEFPALTTLYLKYAVLSNEFSDCLLSRCANLKNLTLESCDLKKSSICHPRLSNLALDYNSYVDIKPVNLDTPKLENLTIKNMSNKKYVIKIDAPHLTSFVYKGFYSISLCLSTDSINSLKKADVFVYGSEYNDDPIRILSLLQHLYVKFLVLNLEIVELLSLHVEEILPQPFMFTNLKRLTIWRPKSSLSWDQALNKSYFLDFSPGATLEEIVAQSLVVELQFLLKEEKANTKKVNNKSYTENPSFKIEKRESKDNPTILKLRPIEKVLEKLPASKKALIQPSLASIYAEASIVNGEESI